MSTTFPEQSTQLLNLTEAQVPNECPGYGDEGFCGDELPEGVKLCPRHQHEVDEAERRREDERDWTEEVATLKRTQYSRFEDEEEVKRLDASLAKTDHLDPFALVK